MSNNNIETNIDCGNKKIKIKNITSKDSTKCTITKIGNKLTELCDGKKSCKVINNILECPGIDLGISYGCIDDLGEDITGNINIRTNSNITTPGNIDINSSMKTNIQSSMNQSYIEPFINESIKNSISYRINNMEYSQSSENIKNRSERLSGGMGKQNIYEETKTEQSSVNLVMNQEEKPTTVNMSEGHDFSEIKPETIATNTNVEQVTPEMSQSSRNPILAFIDKYKFWIVVGLVVIILLFITIAYFYGGSNDKTSDIIKSSETVNLSETMKSSSVSGGSLIKTKTSNPFDSSVSGLAEMKELGFSPVSELNLPVLPKFMQDLQNAAMSGNKMNLGNTTVSSSPLVTEIQVSPSSTNPQKV